MTILVLFLVLFAIDAMLYQGYWNEFSLKYGQCPDSYEIGMGVYVFYKVVFKSED